MSRNLPTPNYDDKLGASTPTHGADHTAIRNVANVAAVYDEANIFTAKQTIQAADKEVLSAKSTATGTTAYSAVHILAPDGTEWGAGDFTITMAATTYVGPALYAGGAAIPAGPQAALVGNERPVNIAALKTGGRGQIRLFTDQWTPFFRFGADPGDPHAQTAHADALLYVDHLEVVGALVAGQPVLRLTHGGGGAEIFMEWRPNDSTTPYGQIDANGYLHVAVGSAPADAALANGECAFWVDGTTGMLNVKGKTSLGVVFEGTAHKALTIGADAEHSLAGQVLSGADASATQKGHATTAAGPDADIAVDAAGAAGTAGSAASRTGHGHKLSTSASNPVALGTAAPGTLGHPPSRDDHVHPTTGLGLLAAANTFTVGPQEIDTGAAGNRGLIIKGVVGQSVNLQEWRNFQDVALAAVNPGGSFMGPYLQNLNSTNSFLTTTDLTTGNFCVINRDNVANVPFSIRGMAAQTGDLQEWQNSAGTVLTQVLADGGIQFAGDTTTKIFRQGVSVINFSSADLTTAGTMRPNQLGVPSLVDGWARVYIGTNGAGFFGLVVAGAAGQTANLTEWRDSAGAVMASISRLGVLSAPAGTGSSAGILTNGIDNQISGAVGLTLTERNTGLQITLDGIAGVMFKVNAVEQMQLTSGGLLKWSVAGNQQLTVGAAGGASALPATPTKYLKVVDSAGTTLVVPAYAAA